MLAIVPSLIAWYIAKNLNYRNTFLIFAVVHVVGFILLVNLKFILPQFDVLKILAFKQKDFINLAFESKAGSYIKIVRIDQSVLSLIKASPLALVNVLLRPFPTEASNIFMALSSVENLLLVFAFIAFILFPKRSGKPNKGFWLTSFFFVLTLALLIGWVTPILGAIVRYKIPLLPFCYILLFSITDFKKMTTYFKLSGLAELLDKEIELWTK
jgi:hypothetical protein